MDNITISSTSSAGQFGPGSGIGVGSGPGVEGGTKRVTGEMLGRRSTKRPTGSLRSQSGGVPR